MDAYLEATRADSLALALAGGLALPLYLARVAMGKVHAACMLPLVVGTIFGALVNALGVGRRSSQ